MNVLENVNVLDFTQSIAGPVGTQLLASLGAEVVKVEPPEGDAFRPMASGATFASYNLNKRSICIDLGTKSGQGIATELAAKADVIVESFRPGVMEKFGLSYESVLAMQPDVIYCSISGFGQDGPYRDNPAYDPVLQAMGGVMDITGYPDRPPVRLGTSGIDWSTGLDAAFSIVTAFLHRYQTGEGQHIDISLYDVALGWMGYWVAYYSSTGEVPTRAGPGFYRFAPYGIYPTKDDDEFYMAVSTQKLFERLCHAINRPKLLEDTRFKTRPDRWQNREELDKQLSNSFIKYECEEIVELLINAGVPVGPLRDIGEVVDECPQADARDMLQNTYNLYLDEPVKTAALPFRFSGEQPTLESRPPRLGEHNKEVLREEGYSDNEIESLINNNNVVGKK